MARNHAMQDWQNSESLVQGLRDVERLGIQKANANSTIKYASMSIHAEGSQQGNISPKGPST